MPIFDFLRRGSPDNRKNAGHSREASNSRRMLTSSGNEAEKGAVERQGELEKFASAMPTEVASLADKLDTHKAGTLFKYAVINNKPSDDRSFVMSKLRTYKANDTVENLSINDLPAIQLTQESTVLRLSDALPPLKKSDLDKFVLVDSILVHFIPLDSFASEQSVVTVQVNDTRKINHTCVRRAKISSTMGYNLLFTLDYCIDRKSLDKMTLSFTCFSRDFNDGASWAAVKCVLQLQILGFPVRAPLQETMGSLVFAETDLERYMVDPREIDLVTTPNAMQLMRDAHSRGEIENKAKAVTDKKELMTAKTAILSETESSNGNSQKDELDQKKQMIARQKAAMEINRKKLEKMGTSFKKDKVLKFEDEDDGMGRLKEIGIADSFSQQGEDKDSVMNELVENGEIRNVRVSG